MSETTETPQPKTIDNKDQPVISDETPSPAANIKKAFDSTISPRDLVRDLADPEKIKNFEAENPLIEKARENLGDKFFGAEEIRKIGEKLDVQFDMGNPNEIGFNQADLELTKKNGEMIIFIPKGIKDENGQTIPMTFYNILDRLYKPPEITHSNNINIDTERIKVLQQKSDSDIDLTPAEEDELTELLTIQIRQQQAENQTKGNRAAAAVYGKDFYSPEDTINLHNEMLLKTQDEEWANQPLDSGYYIISQDNQYFDKLYQEQDSDLLKIAAEANEAGANYDEATRQPAALHLFFGLLHKDKPSDDIIHTRSSTLIESYGEPKIILVSQTKSGPDCNYQPIDYKAKNVGMRPGRRIKPQ